MKSRSRSEAVSSHISFLRNVSLFAQLPDKDLRRVCAVVTEEFIPENEVIFTEGDVGNTAYVITEGEIDILKGSGGQTILLATRTAGEVIGEMSLLEQSPRSATGRARTDCKVLSIGHEELASVLNTSPSAARAMLTIVSERLRSTELLLRQSEKMAQLGTLTAGITHELNNPSSAVSRGAGHLVSAVSESAALSRELATLGLSTEQWESLGRYEERARNHAAHPLDQDGLEAADREEAIESWLAANEVDQAWEIAPVLVGLEYDLSDLEQCRSAFPGPALAAVLRWMATVSTTFTVLSEVKEAASRIGEIVDSLKSYVYLDQGAVQTVDVRQGLENTLAMLRSSIGDDIDVERNFADDLPSIQAYGGELNQVWTNIIGNAVDAMNGTGRLQITTRGEDDRVVVEIQDSGPGIPDDVLPMLFSPFFTTKPVGSGAGLGLNISFNIVQKHRGQISVSSRPGQTRFSIRLPVNFNAVGRGLKPGDVTQDVPVEDS